VLVDPTGRGVPLVELRSTGNITSVTDSAGLVAFDEPGLMHQKVFFNVSSHGYELGKDGFGISGRAFANEPGGHAQLKNTRLNVAERLYRVTGGGIYRDSVLLGRQPPVEQPLLNAQVIGSDSVQSARFGGRLHWFWGDTVRPSYPLGNFHMTGATLRLPSDGGLDPERGIDLHYFTGDDGFVKPTCRMEGAGPTWMDGLAVLPDRNGREQMLGAYAKIKDSLSVYRRGICQWNAEQQAFEQRGEIPLDAPLYPYGHPLQRSEAGMEYVYFGDPFPLVRVPARAESYVDLSQYEAFTWLVAGSALAEAKVQRDAAGRLVYGWKAKTPALNSEEEAKLVAAGKIKPDEARLQPRDRKTGQPIVVHRGSVAWNDFRKCWISIFCQYGGTSPLGEIWYAEAQSPQGPWTSAVKVVSHNRYSFYNPMHHTEFGKQGGRVIFFEGTYTAAFSGNPVPTPRYDYNQIMYKLDLSDPRLGE
jgi:hypothetical protein